MALLTCGVCGHHGEDGTTYNHDCYWVFRERGKMMRREARQSKPKLIYEETYKKPGMRVLDGFLPSLPFVKDFSVISAHILKAGAEELNGERLEYQELRVCLKPQNGEPRALAPTQVVAGGWRVIAEGYPDGRTVLATNNLKARDAYGLMSHVWIGFIHKSQNPDEGFTLYDSADRKVINLTHWHPLPDGTLAAL